MMKQSIKIVLKKVFFIIIELYLTYILYNGMKRADSIFELFLLASSVILLIAHTSLLLYRLVKGYPIINRECNFINIVDINKSATFDQASFNIKKSRYFPLYRVFDKSQSLYIMKEDIELLK